MASESVTIPAAAIPELRRMLIIGQAALAEVEGISADQEVNAVPNVLGPRHPTGAPEMGSFASALQWLECVGPVEGQSAELQSVAPGGGVTMARLDAQDKISELASKAIGILQVMRYAPLDDLPDNAVHCSSWAVEGMVRGIAELADQVFA